MGGTGVRVECLQHLARASCPVWSSGTGDWRDVSRTPHVVANVAVDIIVPALAAAGSADERRIEVW